MKFWFCGDGSIETLQMCRHARAFAVRMNDTQFAIEPAHEVVHCPALICLWLFFISIYHGMIKCQKLVIVIT